jgi:hypothetical protein
MADNYSVFNPTVDLNPYANQIAEIQRRQRMAQLLQQQGMEPLESQVVGGQVIRTSPWQVLAKALQTGMGAYQESKANKAAAELQDQIGYEQRQRQAEIESAGAGIAGRLTGEKPQQYDAQGMPINPRPTEEPTAAPQMPDGALEEITPTGKYTYDPAAAFRMAMTPTGAEAMKGNPALASLLAQTMKPKTLEVGAVDPSKFTPESIRMAQSTGDYSKLQPIAIPKEITPTTVSKLIAELNALPANDPNRKIYEAAIAKEITQSSGVTVNYGTPVAGVDDQGNPVFFQPSRGGGAPSIVQGVRPRPEAMGAAESNAATFADRMNISKPTLDSLPPVPISQQVAGAVPLVGNNLINARARQFKQAEQDFISAVLRKESGAVIGPDEYAREVKKYIPLVGDDPTTLEMKRKSREAALSGMVRAAGPSYKPATTSVQAPTAQNDPLGLR